MKSNRATYHKSKNHFDKQEMCFSRVVVELNSSALLNNYDIIRKMLPDHEILPMVKADAYGHGASWAARHLVRQSGLYGFGVATLEEGRQLRESLEASGRFAKHARIIVLSGTVPWSEEKGQFCERYGLTAVIATEADWGRFHKGGWAERIPYELKFNTGMNRLGIHYRFAESIARTLNSKKSFAQPQGIMTHLANAENPDSRLSLLQKERFIFIKESLSQVCPSARFHMANSSALWNLKQWGLKGFTDVIRPGITLWGVPPTAESPKRSLIPVMSIQASVIMVHELKKGEGIGYGPTYRVEGSDPSKIAVLSMGYADGLPRALSNRGFAWLGGRIQYFLGNISMDMSTVSCTNQTVPGDWAEIVGSHVEIWTQAQAAFTIPYEIMTSISSRVQRIYV